VFEVDKVEFPCDFFIVPDEPVADNGYIFHYLLLCKRRHPSLAGLASSLFQFHDIGFVGITLRSGNCLFPSKILSQTIHPSKRSSKTGSTSPESGQ
jgi:hypothetical protein